MKQFTITDDHLKLLKRAYVRWDNCEFGAPAIDSKRPYGNSDVLSDIREILHKKSARRCPHCGEDTEEISSQEASRLSTIHQETQTALQIILRTGEFEPGTYVREDIYSNEWARVL